MTFLYKNQSENQQLSVLRTQVEFGLTTLDLVSPPLRFWTDSKSFPALVNQGVDSDRVLEIPLPARLLINHDPTDNPAGMSRRSLARLFAFFLLVEDPQRKLDVRNVETLAHQVSLVQHIMEHDNLRKVLIADEVGLGKTVEVGLLIGELAQRQPGLKVLYLAPARLVSNVRREFDKLGLSFRQWTAADGDARLTDSKILASLHRAIHGKNFDKVLATGHWDVLVVDECHHLSAWNVGGGDPRESYRLVRELITRQRPGSRVILLSGTPHQGNMTRFENLLRLLRNDNEPDEALGGRVIYRTKEDIRDWYDNRLFPPRKVNEETVIDLGPDYRAWIRAIHSFFRPQNSMDSNSTVRQRAAGWRCAQALQWAVSSPQAGLGYLVRQAVRSGWKPGNPVFDQALAALRPYRLGDINEPIESLFQRIFREVKESMEDRESDLDDIEVEESLENPVQNDPELENLLRMGIEIVQKSGNEKWQIIKERLLDQAESEKVVLFAQPIETVVAISRFLEHLTGKKPALIVGGQSDVERQKQVDSFWRKDGPQYLISSKAGGEGINLQVARRLIHLDVPWNPMDMEQRVGRVHRFGSTQTILIDTVVVKNSREADAYRIARRKLHLIAQTMVEPDKFEMIFSRVMCLLPQEDLQNVLMQGAQAPLSNEDQQRLAEMVQQGFNAWEEFHKRFGKLQQEIKKKSPGLATWQDLRDFLIHHGKAKPTQDYQVSQVASENSTLESSFSVMEWADGTKFVCGDTGNKFLRDFQDKPIPRLGLNSPHVLKAIRQTAFPEAPTGAAWLRWSPNRSLPLPIAGEEFAVFILLKQVLKTNPQMGWIEQANHLLCYVMEAGQEPVCLEENQKGLMIRGLFDATCKTKIDDFQNKWDDISQHEERLVQNLRKPSHEEIVSGIRYSISPLFCALVMK